MIDSLVQNCEFCANHIAKKSRDLSVSCAIVVLVPDEEHQFWTGFFRKSSVIVVPGSKDDVLDRYLKLDGYDFIVRLTSDCPNVPPLAINKAIFTAIHHDLDYLSNSWDIYRTSIDGHDIEIISARALKWLGENAKENYDREHVTPAIRTQKNDLKCGILFNKEDLSMMKLCVDTSDEYFAAVRRFESAQFKRNAALKRGLFVNEY